MKRVITIGGLHGTGKSSVADRIAKEFGLRRISAGEIFRTLAAERGMTLEEFSRVAEGDAAIDRLLDDTLVAEAAKGNAVIDGQLAAWMARENADLNILLTAPLDVRVARIAQRDGRDFEDAKRETVTREGSERARYREYYGVDITDLSVYDIILNTAKYTLNDVVTILRLAVQTFFAQAQGHT
ncbi:MAG: AAA family ATPase [Candidatus Thorarchaeota archaeon]|nr:AAA family ATPase [Candidatus Thorarchaeota archaeon]